ncbi:hypothetical protein Q8A73_002361 [Channa argus]|nr:hypothetical protein Q8A73_002361 [Channa argus]
MCPRYPFSHLAVQASYSKDNSFLSTAQTTGKTKDLEDRHIVIVRLVIQASKKVLLPREKKDLAKPEGKAAYQIIVHLSIFIFLHLQWVFFVVVVVAAAAAVAVASASS